MKFRVKTNMDSATICTVEARSAYQAAYRGNELNRGNKSLFRDTERHVNGQKIWIYKDLYGNQVKVRRVA